jgi:two-component system, NtrC family, sensor histidine kinase KinB
MTPPSSLRARIRNGFLLMLALALTIETFGVLTIHKLDRSIGGALYRNYVSIESAQHMHAAIYAAELAQVLGTLPAVLQQSRDAFTHWINLELTNLTELREEALARDIQEQEERIFRELSRGLPGTPSHQEFDQLHQRLDDLIQIDQAAMFRADSRMMQMSDRLAYEFTVGLVILLVLGAALSWTLAWNISKPLAELSEHLRGFNLRGPSLRLAKQPLAELQAVSSEFNRMAERLEQFEKLNVDRLIYEKDKTEAIVESIEDGIVLIDPGGVVTHINDVAAAILGVERDEALGSAFDDLSTNHPHYLRVRSALRGVAAQPVEEQRVEVDLHVRGRGHTYVLKRVPLRQENRRPFGTILILQDVTFLRDKDRARTNLVANLSHELKTPLTSLVLSTELLERSGDLTAEERKTVVVIREDVARMTVLVKELLDFGRGEASAIVLQTVPIDFTQLLRAVTGTFRLHAEGKPVHLKTDFDESAPKILADPMKLSWVVSNLVANALRHTPAGGTISVSSKTELRTVRLQVRDTGSGITPELREHLFELFDQRNVNGAEPGSAGLGLAIAKQIVEAHKGRIFVESTLGEGTCFRVELPAAQEPLWQSC